MAKYFIILKKFINITSQYKSNTEGVFISVGEQLCRLLVHYLIVIQRATPTTCGKIVILQVMGECHMTFLGVLEKGLKGREMSRVQEPSSLKYENSTWDCLSYF